MALNVVCLTGHLVAAPEAGIPLRPGWSSLLLRVPRRGLGGEDDAGSFNVSIVLAPGLASKATSEHEVDNLVAVVGMLVVDTDYSCATPRIYYAIVAESIEPLAPDEGTRAPNA